MSEVIRAYVTEVIVCDPRRNKLLGEDSKANKPDARNWRSCYEPVCFDLSITATGDAKIERTGTCFPNANARQTAIDGSDQGDL